MALTPDQEREYLAELERMGVSLVRSDLEQGKIPPHWLNLTATWLSTKDREAEARRAASSVEQMELMRTATEAAERASAAAERSAAAAEKQASASERANTRSTIAIIIAIISAVAAAFNIWMAYLDAHK
jgi:phage terminase Nu1 subunit (DNA packaging protein)